MPRTARLDLKSDLVRGVLLSLGGIVLIAVGASIPVPTGGGLEAVAAGVAILLGFSALLLGLFLYILGTRL